MSLLSTKAMKAAPNAAASASATSGGSAWSNGSYVELLSATGAAAVIVGFRTNGGAAAAGQAEFDFATGSAGSETVIATTRISTPNPSNGIGTVMLPIPVSGVANGGRIAFRVRSSTASQTYSCTVLYVESIDSDDTTGTLLSVAPSAADGASVTPSGTAWNNSSWVQLTSGLASASSIAGLSLLWGNMGGNVDFEIDIGTGGAGSETVVTTVRGSAFSNSGSAIGMALLPSVLPVSGTPRIAYRIRKTGTNTTGWSAALMYYAGLTGAVEGVLAASGAASDAFVGSQVAGSTLSAAGASSDSFGGSQVVTGDLSAAGAAGGTLAGSVVRSGVFSASGASSETDVPPSASDAVRVTQVITEYTQSQSGELRATQVIAETVHADVGELRVTQVIAEVLKKPVPGDMRLTQQVLEILVDTPAVTTVPVPCDGGGDVDTGTNPAPGTSLLNATLPLFYAQFTVGGLSVTAFVSSVTLVDATLKKAVVLDWGTLTRALGDTLGAFESASFSMSLSDVSREFREYMASGTLMFQEISLYAYDDAVRRSTGATWRVFHGRITNYRPEGPLQFHIEAEDFFTCQSISSLSDEKMLPQRLIDQNISDFTPLQFVRDKAVPIIYGEVSDADEDNPQGAYQLRYVNETSQFYTDYGLPRSLNVFLVAGHACNQIHDVFVADYISGGTEPQTYIPAPDSAFGDWIWSPDKPNWPLPHKYWEWNGERYTIILARQDHIASRLAREEKMPFRVNVCGVEEIGDGTGLLITSLPLQFLHFLVQFVILNYKTGNWAPIPVTNGATYSVVDGASFYNVKSITEGRVEGGYVGAGILGWDGEQHQVTETIEQWCTSGGFELFVNRHGQLALTMLDRTSSYPDAVVLTDQQHILEDSLEIDPGIEQVENEVVYFYKQNYVDAIQLPTPIQDEVLPPDKKAGDWGSGILAIQDAGAIAAYSGVVKSSQEQYMVLTRDPLTADDVAGQRLDLKAPPRPTYTFDVPVTIGSTIELGDVVKITHFMGVGATGVTLRRMQVRRHVIDPNELTVRLSCLDVDDLLDVATPPTPAPGGTPDSGTSGSAPDAPTGLTAEEL